MTRKRWFIGTVVAALMALGIAGGAVMAQEGDGDSPISSFASRVAEILGIEETRVQDAMDQARREMFSERLQAWLDEMVESGRITQEQADEYKTWIESRPEGAFEHFGKRGFRGRGFHGDWDRHHRAPEALRLKAPEPCSRSRSSGPLPREP